jgi:hypothetical protein
MLFCNNPEVVGNIQRAQAAQERPVHRTAERAGWGLASKAAFRCLLVAGTTGNGLAKSLHEVPFPNLCRVEQSLPHI